MISKPYLQSLIGKDNTLIITCLECCMNIDQPENGQAFTFTTLGNIIDKKDTLQMETILNYLDENRCSKIVVAGHLNCKALPYILKHISKESPSFPNRRRLERIISDSHGHLLSQPNRQRLLVDLNVIDQCRTLAQIPAIGDRLLKRELRLIGIVINEEGQNKQVFSNDLCFNDFVSMN